MSSRYSTHIEISPCSEADVLRLQCAIRTWLLVKERKQRIKMFNKRKNVAQELLQTEREYVQNLNILISSFLKPLLNNKGSKHLDAQLISELNMAVSGLDVIAKFHNTLQADVESCLEAWHPASQLGKIFLQMAFYLKSYSQYVNHYQNVVQLLAKRKSDKQLQQLLESLKPQKTGKGIKDYMIMPIQRIPRYEMLLAELLRATWKSHVDHSHLSSAHSRVQEVAVALENQSADASSVARVMELSSIFTHTRGDAFKLVVPHRRYIAESECNILYAENTVFSTHQVIRVYLFNDVLLFAKPKKEKLSIKEIWFLRSVTTAVYPKLDLPLDENNCYEFWEDEKRINFAVDEPTKWSNLLQTSFRGGKAWLPHDTDSGQDDNRYKAIPPPPPLPFSKQAKKRLTKRSFFSSSKRESSFARAFDSFLDSPARDQIRVAAESAPQLSNTHRDQIQVSPTSSQDTSTSSVIEQFEITLEFDENPLESPFSSRNNTPASSRVNSETITMPGELSESEILQELSSSDTEFSNVPGTPERLRRHAMARKQPKDADTKMNVRMSLLEQIEKINVNTEEEEEEEESASQSNIDTSSSPLPSRVAKKQKVQLTKTPKFNFADEKIAAFDTKIASFDTFPKKELSDLPLGSLPPPGAAPAPNEPVSPTEKSQPKERIPPAKSWSTSFAKKRTSLDKDRDAGPLKSPTSKEKRKQSSSDTIIPPLGPVPPVPPEERAGRSPTKPKSSKKLEKIKKLKDKDTRPTKKAKTSLPMSWDSDEKLKMSQSAGNVPGTFLLSPRRDSLGSTLLPADEKTLHKENCEIPSTLSVPEKSLEVSPRIERKKSRSRRDHSKVASSMGTFLPRPPSPKSAEESSMIQTQFPPPSIPATVLLSPRAEPAKVPPPVPPRRLTTSRSLPQIEVDCTEGMPEVVTRKPSGQREIQSMPNSESDLLHSSPVVHHNSDESNNASGVLRQPSLDGITTVTSVLTKFKELEQPEPGAPTHAQLRNSNSTSAVAVSQIIKKFSGEFHVEDCMIPDTPTVVIDHHPPSSSNNAPAFAADFETVKVKSLAAKFLDA